MNTVEDTVEDSIQFKASEQEEGFEKITANGERGRTT